MSGSGKGAEENLEMPVVLFYLAKLKVKPETIIRDSQFLLFSLEHSAEGLGAASCVLFQTVLGLQVRFQLWSVDGLTSDLHLQQ